MNTADITQATVKGLDYIESQQHPDGGLESFSSQAIQPFTPAYRYRTTFVASIVLSALSEVDHPQAIPIRKNLVTFLLGQKSRAWSYNYWARGSAESKSYPYPDDIDDTFCALSALVLTDDKLASEAMLAAAVKILIATETKPGGPYRTWLVPKTSKPAWLDVDVAVNANVAYFLSLASEPLPSLISYLDKAIENSAATSPYYPPATVLYFLSRNYHGKQRLKLLSAIRAQFNHAKTPIEQALLSSALLRLGSKVPTRVIKSLQQAQAADGSWPAAAFSVDPARDGKIFYLGSPALTTALVLETLCRYKDSMSSKVSNKKQQGNNVHLLKQILSMTRAGTDSLAPELKKYSVDFIRRVAQGSSGQEIINLPFLFNASLQEPLTRRHGFLVDLASGNLYGWTSYTIYDDFIDGAGEPKLLPVANAAHRRSLDIFQDAGPGTFKDFVSRTFDVIDSANAWELEHCRFHVAKDKITVQALPSYGQGYKLAERSLGHLLGPMAILNKRGHAPDSEASKHVERALKHYLIARQLNDDAHDWQEDFKQGQISYVVAAILVDLKITLGRRDVSKLEARMQRQFWHSTLQKICGHMERHLVQCRKELKASQLFKPDSALEKLVNSLESSIQEIIKTQSQAENFLKQYGLKNTLGNQEEN